MGTWNIRILHNVYPDGEHEFFPAEVYYSDDMATEPNGYTDHKVAAESIDDLKWYAREVLKACDRPTLESGDAFPLVFDPA